MQSLRSRSCSIRTQQLHRSAYIAFLKYGNYLDKIDYSAEEVRMVKGRKGNKGKLRDEIVPFTSEEVGKLLEGASSPMHRCLFGLAVGLGLRPSEALNVRWEDFEDDKIRIRGTKTDMSDAIIPMTGLADREVERWREESKRHGSSFLAAKSHQDKSKRGFALKMTGGEGEGSGGGGGGKGSEGALPLPDGVTSRRKVKYVQIRKAVSDWSVSSAWERDFEDIATAAKYMNVSAATAKRVANNLQEHVAGWEVGYTTKLVDVYDENVAVKFGHANEQGMVGVTVLKVKKAGRAGGAAEAAEIVFKEKNAEEECAKYLNTTVKRIEKVLDGNAKTLKGHEIYWGTKLEKAFSMKKIVAPIGSYSAGGWGEEEDRGWEGKGWDNVELKGRLFVNAKNGEPIGSFKKALSTTCVKAEINYFEGRPRRVFPYLLRHSFATLAATSSPPVPIIVAQKVMRHSSSKLLLEVYARAGEGVVREGLSNFKL
ncbi:hypothetical protein TL16_g00113 [Triparma laevis f. inornata]|uniref:Tyr recombinase domain-containing protein n=1 Tax=Triparma laevis f. inornata TaxID=1714386 RepID=A0A9W6ZBP8_9STRA|nr:hypothetical protein TL16_g00113 [Triparma laevis f. inornata]